MIASTYVGGGRLRSGLDDDGRAFLTWSPRRLTVVNEDVAIPCVVTIQNIGNGGLTVSDAPTGPFANALNVELALGSSNDFWVMAHVW